MTCFYPRPARQSQYPNKNGKFPLIYLPIQPNRADPKLYRAIYGDSVMMVPCQKCTGCRATKSREWAIRLSHEASLHERNCFLTLTYDDAHLPYNKSINMEEVSSFMKRLRERFVPPCPYPAVKGEPDSPERKEWLFKNGIRFYGVGEYGDQFGRPHYHICIFGFDFADKKLYKVEKSGVRLFISDALDRLWWDTENNTQFGHAVIGSLTFESAAYVARYVHKKINGKRQAEHYEWVDEDGWIHERQPETARMSLKPGLGFPWFEKFHGDVFPRDFVMMKGKEFKPPRYYDRHYEIFSPSEYLLMKTKRKENALTLDLDTDDRLKVKELVHLAHLKQATRGLDRDT